MYWREAMPQGKIVKMSATRSVLIISEGTHKQLSRFSTMTGIPMKKVADEALLDWLDTVGAARVVALTRQISQFEKKLIAKTS
jgi:hypothetical protein